MKIKQTIQEILRDIYRVRVLKRECFKTNYHTTTYGHKSKRFLVCIFGQWFQGNINTDMLRHYCCGYSSAELLTLVFHIS